jgi:hypothetical protein
MFFSLFFEGGFKGKYLLLLWFDGILISFYLWFKCLDGIGDGIDLREQLDLFGFLGDKLLFKWFLYFIPMLLFLFSIDLILYF